MSIASYAWGWLLLLGSLALLSVAATSLTAMWFADWDRSTRSLASVALVLAWLFAVSYALGAVGMFRTLPVFLIANIGAATLLLARKFHRSHMPTAGEAGERDEHDDREQEQRTDGRQWLRTATLLAAMAGTVVAVASWLPAVAHSYRYGILEPDSTWYHGHNIGRFLQTGWLTRITPVGTDAMVPFHPMNSEVLDALLIMPWQRDLVIPLVTLAGLGLLLLAGWSIGAYWGRAPAGLVAMALIASPATVRISQPGSLKNDLLAAAFMMGGVALALHGRRRLPAVALSGVMLGLAVGTRTNLLLPAAIIVLAGLAVLLVGHLRERWPARSTSVSGEPQPARWLVAVTWVGALGLFGSFWYLRNWLRVGSPMPWSDIDLGPWRLDQAGTGDERYFEQTIVHWRSHPDLISSAIRPGLRLAIGDLWWAWGVLGIAAMALVASKVITSVRSVWAGDERGVRTMWIAGLAAAGCAGVIGHAATPLSLVVSPDSPLAPTNIAINTRYAVPAFGLVLLAGVGAMTHRWMELVFSVVTLTLIVQAAFPTHLYPAASNDGERADGPLAALLALGLALAFLLVWAGPVLRPRLTERPWPLMGGLAAALVVAIVVAEPALDRYLDRRYATQTPVHGGDLWPVSKALSDARIGMASAAVPYPYLGDDFSNVVFYVGVTELDGLLRDARSCDEWVRQLQVGRFTHVALTGNPLSRVSPEVSKEWTLSVPGARVIHEQENAALIELPSDIGSSCADETDDTVT